MKMVDIEWPIGFNPRVEYVGDGTYELSVDGSITIWLVGVLLALAVFATMAFSHMPHVDVQTQQPQPTPTPYVVTVQA